MTNPFSADSNPFIFAKTKRKTHGDTVYSATFTDDWGRLWTGQADNRTGHPVGALTPFEWSAPHKDLIPPTKYHKFSPQNKRDNKLRIDLFGWITDHVHALEAWNANRDRIAQSNPTAAALAAAGDTSQLDALAGPRPLHVKFLYAMLPRDRQMQLVRENPQPADYARANKWVLGILDRNGQPYPQPEALAAAEVMATLQRKEAYSAATLQDDGSEFANPDEDAYIADDDAAAIVERLDGQEQYAGFDDEPPKPEKRSHHKKVNP